MNRRTGKNGLRRIQRWGMATKRLKGTFCNTAVDPGCKLHCGGWKQRVFLGKSLGTVWAKTRERKGETTMLGWTILFLIIALVAGALGFTGVAGTAAGIARILFTIFLILFLASLIFRLVGR